MSPKVKCNKEQLPRLFDAADNAAEETADSAEQRSDRRAGLHCGGLRLRHQRAEDGFTGLLR